jgi:hypothetical protein
VQLLGGEIHLSNNMILGLIITTHTEPILLVLLFACPRGLL